MRMGRRYNISKILKTGSWIVTGSWCLVFDLELRSLMPLPREEPRGVGCWYGVWSGVMRLNWLFDCLAVGGWVRGR